MSFEMGVRVLVLALLFLSGGWGCTSLTSPRQLVEEGDRLLSQGGLSDPRLRGRMKSLYDEALRRVSSLPQLSLEERIYVETRAHFGLAMARLWDLLDRLVVVLEEGGILRLLREGVEKGEQPAFCPFLQDITSFENIMNLLLDTALKPIIEDFRAVISGDPQFRIRIQRTSYPLSSFTNDRVSRNSFDLSGLYGRAESAFLVGVLELITSAFKAGTAYDQFLNNLLLFLLIQKNIRMNQIAKWFNSNPCVDYPQDGNPLLDPGFGILRKEGVQRMIEARSFALEGIRHIRLALDLTFQEKGDPSFSQRLLNGADPGSPWWTGLVQGGDPPQDRLEIGFPSGSDPPMKAVDELFRLLSLFLRVLTPQIPMDRASQAFARMEEALAQGGMWNIRDTLELLLPSGGLRQLLEAFRTGGEGIPDLEDLETPWIHLGHLFLSPPGDLKLLFPWYYLADEPYRDANGNGRRDPEQGVRLVQEERYLSTEDYEDVNCNGRWDERGDLIVAPESFPFVDRNNNGVLDPDEVGIAIGSPSGPLPSEVGLWGMFLDLNADGFPDRPYVDGLKGSHRPSKSCTTRAPFGVSWPAGEGDPEFYQKAITLTAPAEDAPYGIPVTGPLPARGFVDGSALGPVVGHYYPPRNWDFTNWPFSAQRDPANGVTDQNYFFFSDPTFQRILFRDWNHQPNESGTTNAWLNRMISQWSLILQRFLR
jgi:hypothetical protein